MFAVTDQFDSPDLADLLPSWKLSMTSVHRSKGTIATYTYAVALFIDWCEKNNLDAGIDRGLATKWIGGQIAAGAEPATARVRLQALRSFGNWLQAEGEIDDNPLRGMAAPKLDSKVVDALTDDQVTAMITACKGTALVDRRDEAIIRLMAETGARASEVTDMAVEDVDLSSLTATLNGKGGKQRKIPISSQCATAIDRYMRLRRRLHIAQNNLWVGAGGKSFAYYGLRKSLARRARKAKVENFHLHKFRHTASTRWLRKGGSEGGLMAIAGWSSRQMLDRYTAASAAERAAAEARGLDLGEF